MRLCLIMIGSNNSNNPPEFDGSYKNCLGGGRISLSNGDKVYYIEDKGWKTPLTHIWSKCVGCLGLTTTEEITLGNQAKKCRIWNSDIQKLKAATKVSDVATSELGGNGVAVSPLIQDEG